MWALESLHHCKTKEFDVVILDETRALVANFNSKTLWENEKVNALENIKTLAWLVGKSSYVIAACADGRYDGGFNALVRGVAGTRRIVVWDVKGKKLVRSLKVQFTGGSPKKKSLVMVHASNEPPSEFEQALVAYKESFGDPRGRARVAIACSSKKRARDYGKVCHKLGVIFEIYSSDTADEMKKKHFADPDLSWENVGCLIFTGSLSVAVDPRKTTFGKLFIHTMRNGTQLRDQFQSICRFGRFDGGLFDTEITVLVEDKQRSVGDTRTRCTFADGYEMTLKKQPALLAKMKDCIGAPAVFIKEIPEWALRVMAWAQCEIVDNACAHALIFEKLADMRGWSRAYADHDYVPIFMRFADLSDCNPRDFHAVTWQDTEAYNEVLTRIESHEDTIKLIKRQLPFTVDVQQMIVKTVKTCDTKCKGGFWAARRAPPDSFCCLELYS